MGISWSVGLREDQVFDKAKGEVDRKNWATLNSALNDETAARESVDAEINADKAALWTALQDETTLRAQDDYELRQEFLNITSSETSIRAAADETLKAALDSDVTALKALIDTEREERIANDSAVVEQINNKYDPLINDINTAIANENTLAAKRDDTMFSALSASISAEQKSRGDGDAALQTAINNLGKSAVDSVKAEINARQSADATLQQNIDKVAASITSGSFTVEEFKPSSTTQEGKAGILPAPPKLQTEEQILLPTNFGWKSLADTNIFIGTTPSQKFVPSYTGNTIYPAWKDYEEQKVSVRGDLSAVNAGTYTVYFKPVGLYCWSDGTRGERVVQWTIAPALIAIPTAATTTFDYTGNVISLNAANVDLTKMDKNGQDSATEQGNYSVTYTLKDPANVHWSNNSTAPVTISWKIQIKELDKPSAANTTFTYDGNTKKLDVDNYNAAFMTVTGTTSEINAGTYSVTYALKNKTSMRWADGKTDDVTITWTINRQKLSYAESNLTSNPLEYTGNKQSVSLNGYNSAKHVLSGDTTGTAAGSYTVTVTPNQNYEWYEGGYGGKQVAWSIGSMSFAKPTAEKTVFTYTGNSISLNVQNVNLTYMDKTGSDTATAKGTYWVKYTLKSASYTWADGSKDPVTINWSIGENAVAIPTLTETNYIYNYQSQSAKIANGASDKFTVTGTTAAIDAGTYTITYTLNDPTNTKWADGTNKPKTIEWTIQRQPLIQRLNYTYFAVQSITYDGNVKNLADNLRGYNATCHKLSGKTSMINAGTYTAQVEPTANFAWNDRTTDAKTITWTISPKSFAKPTAEKTAFEYDGATKTLSISGYDANYMTPSGKTSASAKGSYSVTYTLKDTANYCWADGTTAPHVITWTIGANSVAKPTLKGTTSFTYDGTAKSVTVDGYDSTTMTFSGTTSETNAGEYTATYKLKDKTNYAWADGTNDDVVLKWSIAPKKLTATQSNLSLKKSTYTWDGEYNSSLGALLGTLKITGSDITNFNSTYHEITGGNYTLLTQSTTGYSTSTNFTVEVSPKKNYAWNDGTTDAKVFNFKITEKLLPKPVISGDSTFAYDGTTKSITVTNYAANYMTQAGTLSASNVNTYSVRYTLYTARFKSGSAVSNVPLVKWSDGSTNAVTLDWQITAGNGIAKPTLKTTEYEWTGGSITPDIKGYNSSAMNVSGTTTANAIDTYTVTYSLKDKTNTTWADGTTADVKLTWKIVRQKLTNDVTVASNILTYNGNSQEPTLKYGSVQWTLANLSTYCDLSSQTSAVNAGTYTFKATPKSTFAWKDGGTAAKSFDWKINKIVISSFTVRNKSTGAVLSSSVSPDTEAGLIFPAGNESALTLNNPVTLSFEYTGDATLAFCGSTGVVITNPNLVSTEGDTATHTQYSDVTVTLTGKEVTFTPSSYTDTTRVIYVRLVDGTNYAAPSTRYVAGIRIIPQRIISLKDCTWEEVQQIIQSGRTADIWQVGDYKVFDSNGGSVTTELDGKKSVDTYPKLAMTLIGIDHNPDVEGRKRAHFMLTHWTATGTGSPVSALFKSTNATFHMTPQGSFGGIQGYNYSYFKQVVANQILNMLPSDLKNIISPVVKWTADRSESHSVTDKIFLLSAKEVLPGYSGWSGINNVVYDYFANGNYLPGIADKTNNAITVVSTWTRDYVGVADGVAKFQAVKHFESPNGYISQHGATPLAANNMAMCDTYLPCFTIA